MFTKSLHVEPGKGHWDPNFAEHVPIPFGPDWSPAKSARARIVRGFYLSCFSQFERDLRRYSMHTGMQQRIPSLLEGRWNSLHELKAHVRGRRVAWADVLNSEAWTVLLAAQDVSNVLRHGPGKSARKVAAAYPGAFVHRIQKRQLDEHQEAEFNIDPSQFLYIGSTSTAQLLRAIIVFWIELFIADGVLVSREADAQEPA